MLFHPFGLDGAWLIEPDLKRDDRGFFARYWCEDEFAEHGLETRMVQGNISSTAAAGTVRGMHWQLPPALEAKYIRVLRGAIYDVIVDLRPWSPTYLQHRGVELTADNRLGIYVPPMFAHGHQALSDDTEIAYLVSERYTPGVERGMRYDDPRFDFAWPLEVSVVSDKDRSWPDFEAESAAAELEAARP